MNTEYSDNNANTAEWVLYDGDCQLCRRSARRAAGILASRQLQLRTLQSCRRETRLGWENPAPPKEMRFRLADGRMLGGADALMEIARRIGWAWPLWLSSRIPGVMPVMRAAYSVLAANRHCLGGGCTILRPRAWADWLPMMIAAAVIVDRNAMPAWVFMWALALSIFAAFKWLTLRRAVNRPSRGPALAYLLAWPGMEADAFLTGHPAAKPKLSEWIVAGGQTAAGGVIAWLGAKCSTGLSPLVAAWTGMIGIVMMLHFGFFQLLSLGWRAAGREAKPLMQSPLFAKSLADFWGRRWNTAFNLLAREMVFRKLVHPLGARWATLGVFLASGLVHDLVISLPARGGYGRPTVYFLLQCAGLLFERGTTGRKLGLGLGWRGRLFTVVITAAPTFLLFHPPFIHNVILPMLQTLASKGSTP